MTLTSRHSLRGRDNALRVPGKCSRNDEDSLYLRAAQRGIEGGGGEGGGLQVEKLRSGQGNGVPVQGVFCCGVQVTPSELIVSEPSSRDFMFSLRPPDNLRRQVPAPVYSEGNCAPRGAAGQGGLS